MENTQTSGLSGLSGPGPLIQLASAPSRPAWLTEEVNAAVLGIAYFHWMPFTFVGYGYIRFHNFPALIQLTPRKIVNPAVAIWVNRLRARTLFASLASAPPRSSTGFGLGTTDGVLQPQNPVSANLLRIIFSVASNPEAWSFDADPSRSPPPIIWARDFFPTQEVNNMALRLARDRGMGLSYIYGDEAYFHGLARNVRLNPVTIADPALAAWVQWFLDLGRRVDLSTIRAPRAVFPGYTGPTAVMRALRESFGPEGIEPSLLCLTSGPAGGASAVPTSSNASARRSGDAVIPAASVLVPALMSGITAQPALFQQMTTQPTIQGAWGRRIPSSGPGLTLRADLSQAGPGSGLALVRGHTLDGRPGTFYRFSSLPAEIRDRIVALSIQRPAIFYFLFPINFLDAALRRRPSTNSTCNSTWRAWLALASASPEFAHAVRLAVTRAPKTYIDSSRRYPIDADGDLIAFRLPGKGDWTPRFLDIPDNAIYDNFGRGLKRVGVKYERRRYSCAGPHTPGVLEALLGVSPWNMVPMGETGEDMSRLCGGPCRAAFCRYVSFFRDAEVIYVMVFLTEAEIHREVRVTRGREGFFPYVAETLLKTQKAMHLEKWQDAVQTWVEVDRNLAICLLDPAVLHAWELARYLRTFKTHAHPAVRGLINPRMEFKVLVTMRHLRWSN